MQELEFSNDLLL